MEEPLYTAIKAQIKTEVPECKFIAMWNNQVERLQEGKDYSFLTPAVLIEFPVDAPCDQVGNGVRVFDPYPIIFHIVDNRLDNYDGTMEENFEVFRVKQKVYKAFQLFKTPGSSSFNCTSEGADNDHNNVYHFLQTFTTTWTDRQQNLPVGGYEDLPPHTTTITPVIGPVAQP